MKLFEHIDSIFPTSYDEIMQRVSQINPVKYGTTRNYVNGAVTYLSPYISRGIISTKSVLSEVLSKGYRAAQIEKFIQELAWRDYWQQVWIEKGDQINQDLKNKQSRVSNFNIPKALLDANTGIHAIDRAIESLYKTGYMHNHQRMYVASIACNIGQSHWKYPAKWMYYHLLDADWASNALSWQWVSGANSNKKYVANQDNINKYCFTQQQKTFLDFSYNDLDTIQIPEILKRTCSQELKTCLPNHKVIDIDQSLPSLIYNFYNLDPNWKTEILANRILLIEPSHFDKYPISEKAMSFMIRFAEENISKVNIFVGEFTELISACNLKKIYFKEHPLNINYQGIEEPRDWMFDIQGYFPSFFSFWKKCKKQINF